MKGVERDADREKDIEMRWLVGDAGMGAYGMGPGMMGDGAAMGPTMAGHWNLRGLGLTAAQQSQVNKITDELRHKNWDLLGKAQDESARLRDLYQADKFDRAAVGATYRRLGELRQSRLENTLEAREKLEAVLTPEQRAAFRGRAWGPGGR